MSGGEAYLLSALGVFALLMLQALSQRRLIARLESAAFNTGIDLEAQPVLAVTAVFVLVLILFGVALLWPLSGVVYGLIKLVSAGVLGP